MYINEVVMQGLSATTLASENVPITYTSSCYYVKVTHASDMELELNRGCSGALLFPKTMPYMDVFIVLEEKDRCCEGIIRRKCEFGYMEYGTVYDVSLVALNV